MDEEGWCEPAAAAVDALAVDYVLEEGLATLSSAAAAATDDGDDEDDEVSAARQEAYGEFKRAMQMLMYPDDTSTTTPTSTTSTFSSPVSADWSPRVREDLAAFVTSTVRARLRAHAPTLPALLRYLACVHRQYHSDDDDNDSDDEHTFPHDSLPLINKLVSPTRARDPPAACPHNPCVVPPYALPEADIQTLAQAAAISRQRAVESLNYTNGDLEEALRNELDTIHVDVCLMDELVYEYCAYRGLIKREGEDEDDVDMCVEEEASTSGQERCLCWIGRREGEKGGQSPRSSVGVCVRRHDNIVDTGFERRCVRLVREIGMLGVSDATASEAMEMSTHEACTPRLTFHLLRVVFARLIDTNQYAQALALARTRMAPLTTNSATLTQPELLRHFKTLMLALARPHNNNNITNNNVDSHSIARDVRAALGVALGRPEPRLVGLLRGLLRTHARWFQLQMCRDPFAHSLGIVRLLEHNNNRERDMLVCGDVEDGRGRRASAGDERVALRQQQQQQQPQAPGLGDLPAGAVNESAILTLMEFMALSRVAAISLLVEFEGNVEAVLAHLLT
eukprot:jgi/Chlat1/8557/Chrsp82S07952